MCDATFNTYWTETHDNLRMPLDSVHREIITPTPTVDYGQINCDINKIHVYKDTLLLKLECCE